MNGMSIDPFHRPILGIFDRHQYIDDVFEFMRCSTDLFDSRTKSVSYQGEIVSLQPCLLDENIESIFIKYPLEDICEETVTSSNQNLTLLIFANKSIPIGYLTINVEKDRIVLRELSLIKEFSNSDILGGALLVLTSWIAEALNIYLLEATFNGGLEDLIEKAVKFKNLEYLEKEVFPTFVFNAKPIEPRDVKMILTAGPSITTVERNYSAKAAAFGWNAHHSDYIEEFESQFANYVGAKYAIATSSCTGALHLSLLALGIGPGDEVIVPNITWVATASAVAYVGATPVFADVDAKSWTIELNSLKSLITSKTKAIIPVHLYGFAADMFAVMDFARKHNLFVIEDAAPAIGTLINGRAAGTFGDLGCYSFQGAKMLVTGEGGMVVTDSKDNFDRVKKLQEHGRIPGSFWIDQIGHKYKISNIAASIGLAQLSSVERQISRKREINREYRELLSKNSRVKFQMEIPNSRSICWMTSITIDDVDRDDLFGFLSRRGIDTRPTFPRISSYPIWGPNLKHEFNKSDVIAKTGINLPSGVNLTGEKISHVSKSIIDYLEDK
jgi:dTDP-4-amino-4,6-dideoxygalactose transaminase